MNQNSTSQPKKRSWVTLLLKYAFPFVVSIGLCWVLFTGINFSEMMEVIRTDCNFLYIGLGLLLSIGAQVFRAYRWQIQLKALDIQPPISSLIYSIFGTYAVNLVFPRLGEIWRTGYIANRQKASFTVVFGSMVADRLADTAAVLLLVIVTVLFASRDISSYFTTNPESYESFKHFAESPWVYVAIVAVIAACVWIIKGKTSNKIVLKIRAFAKGVWDGFAVIRRMEGKGKWLLYTVGIWGCYFLQMLICFYAFSFTREMVHQEGPIVALVTFSLASVSMGVPSNGGIGPWQFAVVFALSMFGLQNMAEAHAFANVVLGSNTVLLILLGLYTFAAIAFERKRLNRANNKQKSPEQQHVTKGEAIRDNIILTQPIAEPVVVKIPTQRIPKKEINLN